MPAKAYLIATNWGRKIFLCGLDENDLAMRLRLKHEYETANVMFIAPNAADLVARYFHTASTKPSVAKRTVTDISNLLMFVRCSEWSAMCLVQSSELELLRRSLLDLGPISNIDFNAFDQAYDDDEAYYNRFPHVHAPEENPTQYIGIFSLNRSIQPVSTAQANPTYDHREGWVEATNVMPLNENVSEEYVVAATPEELQLVPYVPPVIDQTRVLESILRSRR